MILNESVKKEITACLNESRLNEAVTKKPAGNKRPSDASEWTFADWFGEDLTGQTYEGSIDCSDEGLTSLAGAPKEVKGSFLCNDSWLTSLEGAPKEVGGNFYCNHNRLTSLAGAPKEVGGNFSCFNNKLASLAGAPEKVGGGLYCSSNYLTSLEGAPKEVGGNFNCSYNQLTSLKGAPEKVGGDFECGPDQVFTTGFDPGTSIGSYLLISLKSINKIADTIPDGCEVHAYTSSHNTSAVDVTNEVKKLKEMDK